MLEIITAALVFIGIGVALWVLWNQVAYDRSMSLMAKEIASIELKIDAAHVATNSRMDQLLKVTMDLADATGYKRAQDEQAAEKAAIAKEE